METEGVMNPLPTEMALSCSQPHGRIPQMDHATDKQEMKHSASFSFN